MPERTTQSAAGAPRAIPGIECDRIAIELRMAGGRMITGLDAEKGMVVGSHIRMGGRVFGMPLALDEVVTSRTPPIEKSWQTVGAPKLLIIGAYQMGFHVRPEPGGSRLHVFIGYELPGNWVGKTFGWMLSGTYARWCVRRMLADAAGHFAVPQPIAA